jgi:hypothetical protein
MATTTGLEVLNRDDRNWLSHYTLTGFWQLLLPTVAAQRALEELDPSGTGLAYDTVPATAQPSAPSRNARPH